MPLRHIDEANLDYYLVLFDSDGNERPEQDGSLLSQKLSEVVRDGVTDVFFSSHGWKGDIPAAISQYDSWIGAMAAQAGDRDRARALDPEFKAVIVGVHWPSLPWGNEDARPRCWATTRPTSSRQSSRWTPTSWCSCTPNGSRIRTRPRPPWRPSWPLPTMTRSRLSWRMGSCRTTLESGLPDTVRPGRARPRRRNRSARLGPADLHADPDDQRMDVGGGENRPSLRARRAARAAGRRLPAQCQRRIAHAGASAVVLGHEAPRAPRRRDRRALTADPAAEERAGGAVSSDGPQLRLHRGLRRSIRTAGPGHRHLAPAAPGPLVVPGPRRAVTLVIRREHPVPAEPARLLPADRRQPRRW